MKTVQTECGQSERYGDFYRTWEIEPEGETSEQILDECLKRFTNPKPYRDSDDSPFPDTTEFHKRIQYGGDKWGDMAYYFRGYYTFTENDGKYVFTKVEPFAD